MSRICPRGCVIATQPRSSLEGPAVIKRRPYASARPPSDKRAARRSFEDTSKSTAFSAKLTPPVDSSDTMAAGTLPGACTANTAPPCGKGCTRPTVVKLLKSLAQRSVPLEVMRSTCKPTSVCTRASRSPLVGSASTCTDCTSCVPNCKACTCRVPFVAWRTWNKLPPLPRA